MVLLSLEKSLAFVNFRLCVTFKLPHILLVWLTHELRRHLKRGLAIGHLR